VGKNDGDVKISNVKSKIKF
jgi:hypothetical protein